MRMFGRAKSSLVARGARAMGLETRLTPDRVEVGAPVLLAGFGEGALPVVVPEVTLARYVALLRDGHPGRIGKWYGLDHVIVEWFGVETATESTDAGFSREDSGTFYPGLRATDEGDYAQRCQRLRREWWRLQPAIASLREAWSDASMRLLDAAEAQGELSDPGVVQTE
jgi:hypothetical protein